MKMKAESIRELLLAIESIANPRPQLGEVVELVNINGDIDDNFVLHYELLVDYGFIECLTPNGSNGLLGNMSTPEIEWIDIPIRLTANGHEFIEALRKSEVWEIIKRDFKDESIKTVFTLATDLAKGFAKEKLGKYL